MGCNRMVIYVDIDETICKSPECRDYSKAIPMPERIQKINKLYDEGNTIVYWTARGTGSGIDWRDTTMEQFKKWGVKCHGLMMGKPIYDLFIDDKNINSEKFFKE
jgi:dTDP-glucose 4,6-dehydratase